ncbi:hypothetical protein ICN48_10195 [Polynucleobacter sp. JS-Safj-400b-B2]|jgi:hypothetical protein|uniref:DUF5681 domain-containing protein n=1 Tax=Polynucleobacter sp. JS-Safj-400b-B2 TaxID=2576921 RepID=UPI001C0AFBA3|nr:DUF5681 domain-containing protein [Polynucleobacter sp. JS-Safj-400b-B2]MBU3626600.1 hypothetical protein [Polynucleobacter sp. JS-Safj-400b-B2]
MTTDHQRTEKIPSQNPKDKLCDEVEYDVGYGKPPQHTRFKKGQSGNPAGRRKGRANLGTLLNSVLHATVQINERGKRVTKSKLEIALTQVANKAATGDLKAIAMITRLAQFSEDITRSELELRLNADQQITKEMARALGARMVLDLAQNCAFQQSDITHQNQTGERS